jgi:hypothetical protein
LSKLTGWAMAVRVAKTPPIRVRAVAKKRRCVVIFELQKDIGKVDGLDSGFKALKLELPFFYLFIT